MRQRVSGYRMRRRVWGLGWTDGWAAGGWVGGERVMSLMCGWWQGGKETCGRAGFSHASLGCPSAAASTAMSVRREARSLDSLPCSCSTANRTASIDSCSATRSVLPAAARRAWRAWRVRRCRHIRRQRCQIGAPQSCPRTRHDESKHGDIFPAWQRGLLALPP